jgi:thiol-disulfide isomerase/thioredoxin
MRTRRALIATMAAGVMAPHAFAQADRPPLPPALTGLAALPLILPDRDATLGELVAPDRPSIISFWATWCAPCLMEARHLAELRRQHAPERLAILGINVDSRRDEERLNSFLNRAHVNYAQARGDATTYAAFGSPLPIRLPRLYIFYADGRPVTAFGRYFGRATLRQVDQAVARAFAGP